MYVYSNPYAWMYVGGILPTILLQLLSTPTIDVNATTQDGKTALHLLVQKCDKTNHLRFFPCIQLLLRSRGYLALKDSSLL